jgi:hypothetical protein
MPMRNNYLLVFLILSLIATSCDKLYKDEGVPGYIRINSIPLSTKDDFSEGSSSSRIVDAWIYVDDNLQGVYQLPCHFPILKLGNKKVVVRAGILMNGIRKTRIDYPFYASYDTIVSIEEAKTVEITPRVKYFENTVFHWLETFDGLGLSLQPTNSSPNGIDVITASPSVFEGLGSGRFRIMDGSLNVEIATINNYDLPKMGAEVYLEIDYRINHPLNVGLFVNNPDQVVQESVMELNPTIDANGNLFWNKIYIHLTQVVSQHPFAENYKVYFGALKRDEFPNPEFFIDNIKLVSF